MPRTYTYTVGDYLGVFGERQDGVVGVDPDGDLVWSRRPDLVWASETVVLDWLALLDWRTLGADAVVYSPSTLQRDEFEACDG